MVFVDLPLKLAQLISNMIPMAIVHYWAQQRLLPASVYPMEEVQSQREKRLWKSHMSIWHVVCHCVPPISERNQCQVSGTSICSRSPRDPAVVFVIPKLIALFNATFTQLEIYNWKTSLINSSRCLSMSLDLHIFRAKTFQGGSNSAGWLWSYPWSHLTDLFLTFTPRSYS